MAKVFLESTDSSYTVANNGVTVYGASGSQTVVIGTTDGTNSATGVTVDANVEQVNLSGNLTDYKLSQEGTNLVVKKGSDIIATIGTNELASKLKFGEHDPLNVTKYGNTNDMKIVFPDLSSKTAVQLKALDEASDIILDLSATTTVSGTTADVKALVDSAKAQTPGLILKDDVAVTITGETNNALDATGVANLKAIEAATKGLVDASSVATMTGSIADVKALLDKKGATGDAVNLKSDVAITLLDTTAAAADLKAIEAATTGLVDASSVTSITGAAADVKALVDKKGTTGDKINLKDDVAITLSDAADTEIAATDLSAIGGATSGTVTVSNAIKITGTTVEVKAALVTATNVTASSAKVAITEGNDDSNADAINLNATDISAIASKTSGTVTIAAATPTEGNAQDTINIQGTTSEVKAAVTAENVTVSNANATISDTTAAAADLSAIDAKVGTVTGANLTTISGTLSEVKAVTDNLDTIIVGTVTDGVSNANVTISDSEGATLSAADIKAVDDKVETVTITNTVEIDGTADGNSTADTIDVSGINFTSGEVTIDGKDGDDKIIGGTEADTIKGGDGNDKIYAGLGKDSVDAGAGDDKIVVIGTINTGDYTEEDVTGTTAADLGLTSTITNAKTTSDIVTDESIKGGDGDDTLEVWGNVDLTNATLSGIEHQNVHSELAISTSQLQALGTAITNGKFDLNMLDKDTKIIIFGIEEGFDNKVTSNKIATFLGAINNTNFDIPEEVINDAIANGGNLTVQTSCIGIFGECYQIMGKSNNGSDDVFYNGLLSVDDDGNVDLSNYTNKAMVVGDNRDNNVIGTDNSDMIIGAEGDDTITGNGGHDVIVLNETTSKKDTIIFADTAAHNELDVILGFTSGTDKINVDAFVNDVVGDDFVTWDGGAKASVDTGSVICLKQADSIDDETDLAAKFEADDGDDTADKSGDANKMEIDKGGKFIVIVQDDDHDDGIDFGAQMFYLESNADGSEITAKLVGIFEAEDDSQTIAFGDFA